MDQKEKFLSVQRMTKISILSVIAFILMQLEFPIPIFPSFLEIDLSDLPALIGGLAFGPLVGVLIEMFKNLMHLIQTTTSGVGELANFLVGTAFVWPASYIYSLNKTKKNAIIGMFVGTICMGMVGALSNYFILIPFYANVLKFPIEAIVEMGSVVNSNIEDLWTLILYAIVPFNILKGIVISILNLLIYKRISRIL